MHNLIFFFVLVENIFFSFSIYFIFITLVTIVLVYFSLDMSHLMNQVIGFHGQLMWVCRLKEEGL